MLWESTVHHGSWHLQISPDVVAVALAVAVVLLLFVSRGLPRYVVPVSSSLRPGPLQQLHDPFRQVCKPTPASALASKRRLRRAPLLFRM